MIQEGHLRVVWINSNDTIATPRYTVTFACHEPPEEFSTQKSKAIVGGADLLRFLYVINIDADDLKTGSRVLQERGYVEFANVVLSDERLASFDLSSMVLKTNSKASSRIVFLDWWKPKEQPYSSYRYVLKLALVFALYIGAGKLGLAVPFTSSNISPVWPAAG